MPTPPHLSARYQGPGYPPCSWSCCLWPWGLYLCAAVTFGVLQWRNQNPNSGVSVDMVFMRDTELQAVARRVPELRMAGHRTVTDTAVFAHGRNITARKLAADIADGTSNSLLPFVATLLSTKHGLGTSATVNLMGRASGGCRHKGVARANGRPTCIMHVQRTRQIGIYRDAYPKMGGDSQEGGCDTASLDAEALVLIEMELRITSTQRRRRQGRGWWGTWI
ncbi:hypothetical protein FB45DRAFT_871247 [Roridomyces roridus]|uniref:Uncharacterized protein n=1 Tax=Roridomyces roridus TaxID=1738132 RepID=A0AAD7BG37_9AGAR|nr:hypothetical protein FB45DRAFT_871247 [Roridomyces roridus]